MKAALLTALLFTGLYCDAQTSAAKPESPPPNIYIMPDLNRVQLDSAIQFLKDKWNIELTFERLEYDPTTNQIARVTGKVINKNFHGKCEAGFNSDDFKGLTIMMQDPCGVVVGILPAPKSH